MKLLAAAVVLVASPFIIVHGPDDHVIAINAQEISSIRQREPIDSFDPDVKCILVMTNGKWHGVVETCLQVMQLISDKSRE